jgi:tripartite ATP-independent transporter DctP family solute receptor
MFVGAAITGAAFMPRRAGAAITLRWASVMAPNHPQAIMMERIAKEVREKSSGAIEIQTFPGGQLGQSRDVIEALSSGAIQIVDEGAAQFGQFVAQFSLLEGPYLWRDQPHMRRALSSALMDDFNKPLIERRGMRVIGGTYYGKRHLTTGSKVVRSAEDMKGFKLRIPEVDTFRAMAEAWGARPTPLNFGELYLALSQGAVDGQENPLPTIQSAKFYEVQKNLVLTAHVLSPRLIAINEKTLAGIAANDRAILTEAIATHSQWQDNEILSQEASLVDTFKKSGMNVIEPDLESFRKPVLASVPAKFEAKWGKGLWERIAAL